MNHRLFGDFDDHPRRIKRVRLGLLAGTYDLHFEEFDGKKKQLDLMVGEAAPAAPIVLDLR